MLLLLLLLLLMMIRTSRMLSVKTFRVVNTLLHFFFSFLTFSFPISFLENKVYYLLLILILVVHELFCEPGLGHLKVLSRQREGHHLFLAAILIMNGFLRSSMIAVKITYTFCDFKLFSVFEGLFPLYCCEDWSWISSPIL